MSLKPYLRSKHWTLVHEILGRAISVFAGKMVIVAGKEEKHTLSWPAFVPGLLEMACFKNIRLIKSRYIWNKGQREGYQATVLLFWHLNKTGKKKESRFTLQFTILYTHIYTCIDTHIYVYMQPVASEFCVVLIAMCCPCLLFLKAVGIDIKMASVKLLLQKSLSHRAWTKWKR